MDDKIKEVMGLVDELIGKSIGGGLCSIAKHPDVAKQAQDYANAITTLKSSIESKLRELVESEKAEVERMRGALKGLVDLGMSGESVLFTAEYDRARDALER